MFQSWTGAGAGVSRIFANAGMEKRRKQRSWHRASRGIAAAMVLAAGTTMAQPVSLPEMQVSTFAGGQGVETAAATPWMPTEIS